MEQPMKPFFCSLLLLLSFSSPGVEGGTTESNAVIFDAGSTGSRVHVFRFDENLDLVNIGDDIELFVQVDVECGSKDCTFNGAWSGGGGAGQKNLYVASIFYDKAAEVGFIDSEKPSAVVTPYDFAKAAWTVCKMSLEEAGVAYPKVGKADLPYLCMDLVYEYTLLVRGFGLNPHKKITLVTKVKYGEAYVGAAWPLGSAIEAVSSQSNIVPAVRDLYQFWSHKF